MVVLLPIMDPIRTLLFWVPFSFNKLKTFSHICDFFPSTVIELPPRWHLRSVCSYAAFIPSWMHGWRGRLQPVYFLLEGTETK